MNTFDGIPSAAVEFYEELEFDNSREWWLSHKETYDRAVRGPMKALAAGLEAEFGPAKLFRPNRDVRFSADKSPYKTHQGVVVATSSGMGWYVQISAEGLMTAAGWYAGTSGQVARYRAALDDEEAAPLLQEIVDVLRAGGFDLGGDVLKTRPRGVAADHPFLGLMRHRTLTVHRNHGVPQWLDGAEAADRIVNDWRTYRRLMEWLGRYVGEG